MKTKPQKRIIHNVFAEPKLIELCRAHSIEIAGCTIKSGSASHFFRAAATEKLLKMYPNLKNLNEIEW
jgi:hypothetical protein